MRPRLSHSLIFCVSTVILLAASPLTAQDAPWRAGLARAKITPSESVYLVGYASRNRPFDKILSDIHVKALALEDARGHRAVLVTGDVLGFQASFAEPICAEIKARTGLARAQILLNASHTHTGPLLSLDSKLQTMNMKPADVKRTVAYTRELMKKVVDVVSEAVSKLAPAHLSFGKGVARFVMNRREFTPTGVRLGVNPSGLVDRTVPVLRVDSPDGKLRAVVFGTACHNTTLTGQHYSISGDYAGFAQSHLERLHAGTQAMFMSGCGGCANPFPRGAVADALAHGTELGEEVRRVLDGTLKMIVGPLRTEFEYAEMPLQKPPSRDEIERRTSTGTGWSRLTARRMLEVLDANGELATSHDCPVALWQFGQSLTLVGLSGEVVVEYVPLIEKAIGPLDLWISAYSNDVFGYVPAAVTIDEGGYETRGLYYGGIGTFAREAQDVFVQKVRELAERAGRK